MEAEQSSSDGTVPACARPPAEAATEARSSIDRLRALPILRHASKEVLQDIAGLASWRRYAPGGLIVDLEDATNDVWFVLEGVVRIQARTPTGREIILTDIAAGSMFGEVAAIDGARRTASATSLVHSRLCLVPARAFLAAACSTPAASLDLLQHVTAILRRQSTRLLEREALPVRLRIHAELLRLSRPRSGKDLQLLDQERIVSPPPRRHILAARIGTRREAVSREIADLMRRGVISRERGGLVIHQPQALSRALEAEMEAGMEL